MTHRSWSVPRPGGHHDARGDLRGGRARAPGAPGRAETGDWENADDVAGDAYQAVTGEDIPTGDSNVSGSPRGTPWDDEQSDERAQRYPALAARFR
jgi:hypothetical protein